MLISVYIRPEHDIKRPTNATTIRDGFGSSITVADNERREKVFLYHDTTLRSSGWYSAFVLVLLAAIDETYD
jgi:hypothetical protein